MSDTIFALSSAYGRAGVSVFRISGVKAAEILTKLTGKKNFAPRTATLAKLKNPSTGEIIDEAIVLFFKAPASFTGEDSAEIHTHGSVAVIGAVYEALGATKLGRIARAGEFARRAFTLGKLDLAQAEALADLINAQTESQRKLAFGAYEQANSKLYKKWRGELVRVLAFEEAAIDFAEDELPENIAAENARSLKKLLAEMERHLGTSGVARKIKYGISVAILGKPNVGKSSLFNRIVGESRAIVSPEAGTTRDLLEASVEIAGAQVNLYDTAGLRERARGRVERAGMKLAQNLSKTADIRVRIATNLRDAKAAAEDKEAIVLFNKIDKKNGAGTGKLPRGAIAISAKTGENYGLFLKALEKKIAAAASPGTDAILSQRRHEEAICDAVQGIQAAIRERDEILKAEHLRAAANALGGITGEVRFSEILDSIFSNLCLGK